MLVSPSSSLTLTRNFPLARACVHTVQDWPGKLHFGNGEQRYHADMSHLDQVLGQGTYASVREAVHIKTGRYYAVKVINKKLMEGREHMVSREPCYERRRTGTS